MWYWIAGALIAALGVAWLQYGLKGSTRTVSGRLKWSLLFLRFGTVFLLLLLLIDPQLESVEYLDEKPRLVVLADNSKSIAHLKIYSALKKDATRFIGDKALNDRFSIEKYIFDDGLTLQDTLGFDASPTNQAKAIQEASELYRDKQTAILLFTDGNQTQGRSFGYVSLPSNHAVFPVIYGDTTQYPDLSIEQVNVNRYSYLDNEFPVEAIVSYDGDESITTEFKLTEGARTLYKNSIQLSPDNSSQILSTTLKADKVGLKTMTATVDGLPDEKNLPNNSRPFAVEVIDQQNKVLLLTDMPHPDLGALRKAITSNEQRTMDIMDPSEKVDYNDYSLVIFFNPRDIAFAKAYNSCRQQNINTWTFTGLPSDFDLINKQFETFKIQASRNTDEVQPRINEAYQNFDLSGFNLSGYPPVEVPFGEVIFTQPVDNLIYRTISGIDTSQPLWFTFEENGRHAFFMGNGIWRWRAECYLQNGDFTDFDNLMASMVQFLASTKKRERLSINYKRIYDQGQDIILKVAYLNQNYLFKKDGILNIRIAPEEGKQLDRPLIRKGNTYQVSLSDLEPGSYNFTVSVEGENLQKNGSFTILPFDIEKQQVTASVEQAFILAGSGNVYFPDELEKLKSTLLDERNFPIVQKELVSTRSLVEWEYLLLIVVALLTIEWFIRKYNGLI